MPTSYKLKTPVEKVPTEIPITIAYTIVQSKRDKGLHQIMKLSIKGNEVIDREFGEEDNLMFIGPRILRELSRMDIHLRNE